MSASLAYIAIAYALSITLSLIVGLTGGHESAFIGLRYLSMFLPAVAVLVVGALTHEGPRVDWNRLPRRHLPAAVFLIPAVSHASMLPLMATIGGGVRWQPWLTPGPDGLYHAPASLGWGLLTRQGLAIHLL